jgi:hypothetical protein
MVKLFAWEPRMLERLKQNREQELQKVWTGRIWDVAMFCLNTLIPTAATVTTLAVYVSFPL